MRYTMVYIKKWYLDVHSNKCVISQIKKLEDGGVQR